MAAWQPSTLSWKEQFSHSCRNGDLKRVHEMLEAADCEESRDYALWTVSGYGMDKLIVSVLSLGVNPSVQCQEGSTALHRAANNGHLEAVGVLIAAKADVNATTTEDGSTPLHLASRGGHIPVINKLILYRADVNAQTMDGSTALHFASRNGHHKVVQILVNAKANVTTATKDMTTPIHCASILGSLEIIHMLLKAEASPCVADQDGFTPLHIAAKHGHSGLLEVLVSGGANLWDLTKDNDTVLHLCAQNGNSAAASVLLHASKEREVKSRTHKRWSVSRPGAQADDEEHKQPVMDELDYLHWMNTDGKSALHLAVLNNRYSMVQDLLCSGVDPRVPDGSKWTPLHYAAQNKFLEVIRLLLDHGANLDAKNSEGDTALDIAQRRHHSRAVAILENAAMVMQLLQYGTCECEDVTIAVGGAPGAGKTTFVNSLCTSWMESLFRYEQTRDRGASDPATRTRGIRLVSLRDTTAGRVHTKHIMDFGGHEDFIPAHSLFLSESSTPSMAVVLVDGLLARQNVHRVTQQLEQWCGVFISCNRDLPRRYKQPSLRGAAAFEAMPDRRMPIQVIVSRGDGLNADRRQQIWEAFGAVCRKFRQYLDFDLKPWFVDCRRAYAEPMVALRGRINEMSMKLMKQAGEQPRLIQAIRKALPKVRKQIGRPFSYRPGFTAALLEILKSDSKAANSIDFSGSTARQAIEPALRLMSSYGELVTFESPALRDTIVIEPEWLLTTVVGRLCSPSFFPQPHVAFERGQAARSDVVASLTAPHQPGGLVLDMLVQLGLCVVEQERVIVPGKLPPLESQHAQIGNWQSVQGCGAYAGVRFCCDEGVPLSAGFVVLLQTRTFAEFRQQQGTVPALWLRGVNVKPCISEVQGSLMVHPTRLAVDAVVRGPDGAQRDLFALLHVLCQLVDTAAEQYSPGTVLRKLVLSASELRDKVEHPSAAFPSVTYRPEDVHRAMRGNLVVDNPDGHGEFTPQVSDKALDLLHLPATHIYLMSPQSLEALCAVLDAPSDCNWCHLAERLGFKSVEMATIGRAQSKTEALLRRWARRSPNNTVDRLLDVHEKGRKGNMAAAKILREELQKPFLGTPNIFVARKMDGQQKLLKMHGFSFRCSEDDEDLEESNMKES